ncbi:hypothetical protein AAFF_G00030450 [Aldrovandia affinis]|uniref:Uncharacterized protein n=1 Tax=Aldrovandia affinis TaxID=143900 RepID=A0AAD7WGX6_9TELE|nr:hypothetical protein AAFF_G00030450 [Aldrovandia affinis]
MSKGWRSGGQLTGGESREESAGLETRSREVSRRRSLRDTGSALAESVGDTRGRGWQLFLILSYPKCTAAKEVGGLLGGSAVLLRGIGFGYGGHWGRTASLTIQSNSGPNVADGRLRCGELHCPLLSGSLALPPPHRVNCLVGNGVRAQHCCNVTVANHDDAQQTEKTESSGIGRLVDLWRGVAQRPADGLGGERSLGGGRVLGE